MAAQAQADGHEVVGSATLGTSTASGAALATAATSVLDPQAVSSALMRTTVSRAPKPSAHGRADLLDARSSFASGATESSRSRINASAASVRAFSRARGLDPGM